MADDYVATVRIRRPRVTTDERGRTVWNETIETLQLELVSTGELKQLLESTHDDTLNAIKSVVDNGEQGVLARDLATGMFRIVSEAELRAAIDSSDDLPKTLRAAEIALEAPGDDVSDGDDELSLVSTQVLRKILREEEPKTPGGRSKDAGGGFDPYNKS